MPRIMAIRGGIDLSGNALTAIPTFTGVALQGLGALILADNAIADITPLEALGSTLPYVDLSGNAIVHIPKVDAPWMNALDLSENPIATIEAGLRADEIICRRCGLEDLNVLAPFFARVAVLDLSEDPIASLAPLSAASGLRSLTIDGIAGLDYAANPWLGHLSELVARDSGIVDLAPLVGVERLDLRGNAIADLSPLAGRPGEVYDLRENPVDLDIDLLALYDLCIHDQVTIHWDAGTCVKPADYGES